jgi:bifunctional isochorismate lyase/aryl carrier protein
MKTKLASLRPAVLVLDMQSLFVGADGPFDNPAVVEAVNTFLPKARDAGVPVVFSCYTLRDDLSDAGLLAGQPFVQDMRRGAPLAVVDPRLELADTDIVCHHNRPSAFFRSDLEHVLRSLDSKAVVLIGVSINNAISSTARDAFARDIPAVVVRECVAPAPWEEHLDVYLAVVDTWGAEVASGDDVLAAVTGKEW